MGIAVAGRRDEGLLDRAWAGPADQIPHRAGLVIRAGSPRTAERLLADDCTGGLVIEIEVSRREPKPTASKIKCHAIIGDDGTRETVRSRVINLIERGLEVHVVEDVNPEYWPEVLGHKDVVPRVVGDDQGRPDVPALPVIGQPAGDDLGICRIARPIDRLQMLAEGTLINDRGREVGQVAYVT